MASDSLEFAANIPASSHIPGNAFKNLGRAPCNVPKSEWPTRYERNYNCKQLLIRKTAREESDMNMKVSLNTALFIAKISNAVFVCVLALTLAFGVSNARADETCSSPYLARIDGQEEFVYVWTLGVEGLGDGSDKLVTVDVKPGSPNYGKVISSYFRRWTQ